MRSIQSLEPRGSNVGSWFRSGDPQSKIISKRKFPLRVRRKSGFAMNASRLASAARAWPATAVGGCLACCNFGFLRTREGVVKLLEIILGVACQNLLISYVLTYSLSLGSSYYGFLMAASSSAITSVALLLTYVASSRSVQLVRQSCFEIIHNGIVCFLYISTSCYLAFAVHTFLYPIYKITSLFQAYPAMSLTYIIGFLVGILYGYDGWLAYKKYH